jgi:hypothetical protein
MALIVTDRVMESSTSTGTGNFALAGAYLGYRTFDEVCANGDTCYYCIEALDAVGNPSGAWEVGLGTFNDTDTLVRTAPAASSNAGDAVDFAAGAKRVTLSATAGYLATLANVNPTESLVIACSDETTALTTGTAKVTFRMPYAFTLTAVRASVTTAPTGSTLIVDINETGSTILSTKLSIDASEKTSTTAASAAVISDTALADDAEITIDIDQIGSTIAGAGLKVYLIGTRA